MRLRIVTFNLAGLKHSWNPIRRAVAVEGLRALKPDVLCLQETTLVGNGEPYDQAEDLGMALGLTHIAFTPYGNPAEITSAEQGGLAVAARWPFASVRNRRLPSNVHHGPDARVAQYVSLRPGDVICHVANVHLSWRPDEEELRKRQVDIILNDLRCMRWLCPTVLAGDFNALEKEPAIEALNQDYVDTSRAQHKSAPGYTWTRDNPLSLPGDAPDRRLDYIFCDTDAQVLDAAVTLTKMSPTPASDHFALMADLEWPTVHSD